MIIESYMSQQCTSEGDLRKNIAQALREEGVAAQAKFFRLSDSEAATRNFKGSPTVLIDGEIVQPVELRGFS